MIHSGEIAKFSLQFIVFSKLNSKQYVLKKKKKELKQRLFFKTEINLLHIENSKLYLMLPSNF